ncbi:MAG TPA: isoprenylcysteine carboxylmethyltransferase family protein [Gemmatimonadaceae bacterium]|nr:isoprenylcysteine carboxylmethyltransferase family protein [Gemmatimonadaceae bacterium]
MLRLLLRIPVPWVFVLTYLIGVVIESIAPIRTTQRLNANVTLALGAVVFLIGAIIAGWGLVTFRRARTTTVPGRTSAQLVTWGPYRFTRNPMYVGLTIAYLGETLILRQIWPLVLLPLTLAYVNWVVIPLEQGKLSEGFGEEYARYQARVRRWL